MMVTVLPKIVAGPLLTVTLTGSEELAVGGVIITDAPLLKAWLGTVGKTLMLCADWATVKEVVTSVAAVMLGLPLWLAANTTIPAPERVTVLPEIVAGPLLTVTLTGSEELAVGGVITKDASPNVLPGMVANEEIVCVWVAWGS